MATWHNKASEDQISETILLPGDPLRAKYIADKYLTDPICFNDYRLMYGYSGFYQGKWISVMATGMGIPSMGIYSYELINNYHCKNLIRIGTAGSMQDEVNVGDIVLALASCTDSNYAYQFELPGQLAASCSYQLLKTVSETADEMQLKYHVGNVYSSDVLYRKDKIWQSWQSVNTLASEMESYGLYCNALKGKVNALTILTITCDLQKRQPELSQNDIETNLDAMIRLALESAIKL
ncbi:MAG: purine-nucleoside phosphorylase [Erysipelotrichaceae bacterium]